MLGLWALTSAATKPRPVNLAPYPGAAIILRASEGGAALDSNLMTGAGTDDTTALQTILNKASKGRPVHLIIDGPALVRGLDVHGNTTIECVQGGGLYLKNGSSRAIIRNAHRSRTSIVDERITVRGCFLNGNREYQPGAKPELQFFNNQEPDGTFIAGLEFFGVNDLIIEDITLWSIRSFALWIANANRIDIRNVTVDHGATSDTGLQYANVDGLHFNGPVRYLNIDGLKLRSVDDGLALTANDHSKSDLTIANDSGPYVGQGPITDVTISNVILMDAVQGLKFLSSTAPIDRVIVNNVTGTLKGNWLAYIGNFMNPDANGKIGSLTLTNVNVDRSLPNAALTAELTEIVNRRKNNKILYDDFNEGAFPMINVNAHIDNLTIREFSTRVADSRPIIRLGSVATIRTMTAQLNLQDPQLIGVPLELDAGSRIGRLNLAVDWQGEVVDRGKNPLFFHGGAVEQLNWVGTPPMFVDAVIVNGNTVAVTFSQDVKATDFKSGVTIEINGQSAIVSGALVSPTDPDVVHYLVNTLVRPSDGLTWTYDGRHGFIQNLNGDHLLSVSAKTVRSR